MMSDFYVVLPSNASYNEFPNNKLHSYKVKVPRLLPNSGRWVVGLSEIQFPSTWYNVIGGFITVRWRADGTAIKFELPDGFYESITALMTVIKKIVNNAKINEKVVFYYDEIRNRVLLKVRESNGFGIGFSANLANILGFIRTTGELYTEGIYIEKPADINDGLTALYVYTDVVEKRLVGDSMVPLLRVVPTEPSRTKYQHKWIQFKNIEYVPAVSTNTDTVELNIRRDDGDIIPFDFGKVVVTLHFKKQS